MRLLLSLLAALVLFPGNVLAQTKPLDLDLSQPITVVSNDKRISFCVHVADTWQARQTGLMFQTELPKKTGMLFDFGQDSPQAFWMKNTLLPLDIIFINSTGVIKSIAENTTPFSLDLIHSQAPAQYVLEINAGISKDFGFKPGDRVEIGGNTPCVQ